MISVIMPVHNKQENLRDCLESVLAQDCDKEVILVSDGNTDNSDAILEEYRNKVYKLIFHERPYGVCFSRNAGYAHSRGRYIFWLDGDCILKPSILSRMRAQLECADAFGFVYGDYERVGVFENKPFVAGDFSFDRLLQCNFISTMSLIRKELSPKWDETLERCNDWDYWLSVCERGIQGYYLNEPIFEAHYKPGDISTAGMKNYGYWFQKVAAKHLPIIQDMIDEGKLVCKKDGD